MMENIPLSKTSLNILTYNAHQRRIVIYGVNVWKGYHFYRYREKKEAEITQGERA